MGTPPTSTADAPALANLYVRGGTNAPRLAITTP